MVTEGEFARATQEVENKKSVEYRLNHTASEFVSTDSCSTSTMSVKSEGDEQEQGVNIEDGNDRRGEQGAQRGQEPPPNGASPSRRPMGWESPQVRHMKAYRRSI
jgi:hypothetical protein